MNILLRRFLFLLKRIVPDKRYRVDVIVVGGDWESGFDQTKGFKVFLEEVAAGSRGWVGLAFKIGTVLFDGLEIVFEVLSFPFGKEHGDVIAQGTVEVEGGCFFLVNC